MASIIESSLTIDGNLKCDGDLIINGRVHGDVTAQKLTVSDNGSLQGNISARIVETNGTIAGNITATAINLGENSNTHASVKAEKANIKEGALVIGQLKIGQTFSESSQASKPLSTLRKVSAA
ncbi:MAG: polymer-forming cytoskeletal protein [Paracoccaceae bacterium]|nr:polymer-forming cytoskeletal protein [Paracoccaceae bacterium]